MLKEKIERREPGILLYGITPPKENNTDEKIREIAARHMGRIRQLDIDGLILYDIQDESDRTKEERTFEFIRTVDPSVFSHRYMAELDVPKVVYRCVGNYTPEDFKDWLDSSTDDYTVFVGTASRTQQVPLRLSEAYDMRLAHSPGMFLGAVTIPERHIVHGDEHERVGFKMDKGCSFFVSQAVFDLEASMRFLRDYAGYCSAKGVPASPIIFTFTPCGSEKTLDFAKWLGIHVPEETEARLRNAQDMLAASLEIAESSFKALISLGRELDIPVGCNVESISIRKVEIEASIELARQMDNYLRKEGLR